jgi:hypothetical protein
LVKYRLPSLKKHGGKCFLEVVERVSSEHGVIIICFGVKSSGY